MEFCREALKMHFHSPAAGVGQMLRLRWLVLIRHKVQLEEKHPCEKGKHP